MVKSHKFLMAGALALAALLGSGCGGNSASHTGANIFAGSYEGTWLDGAGGENGASSITITTDDQFYGTAHDATQNVDYTVSAWIKDSGYMYGTITPAGGTATTISGILANDASGHFSGTLQQTYAGNRIGELSFDLVKQP